MSFSTSTRSLVGPCPARPSGAAPLALRATSPLRREELGCLLFFLGVLDHCEDARRDEPRGADNAPSAGQLSDLDRRARAAHLDTASGPGGLDDVFTGRAAAGVHQDFHEISFSTYASMYSQFVRYLNVC